MPVFNEDEILNSTQSGQAPNTEEASPVESTGFLDAAAAFYQMEDPVFNTGRELFSQPIDSEFDPEFKPLEKLQKERPDLLDDIGSFTDVRNEEEYNIRVERVEYEREQREIFAKAPTITKITAGLAASIIDPTMLIPYVGIAKKASRIARIGRGAAVGLGVGAGTSIAREGILQGTQLTRTADESMINIVVETAFGGVLGAAAGAVSNPVKAASKQIFAKALAGEDFKIEINEAGTSKVVPDSAGAAAKQSEVEELGLARINEQLAKIASGPEFLRPPDLRAILSPSASVRKLGEVFYNSNFIRNKNVTGEASPVRAQNAIFRREQNSIRTIKEVEQMYLDYTGKGIIGSTLFRPKGIISSREFSDRIWKNLVDETRVDQIDQVNKAAQLLRKDLDEMVRELQAAKLLPKDLDPKFIRNYMTRIYDLDKLQSPAAQARFVTKVKNWIKKHNKDGSVRASVLEDDAAEEIALDILDKIRGETDQQIALSSIAEGFISKGKFLKERQLLIPDAEIAEFLQTDSLRLFKNYMSRASKLLETQKALNRAGFEDIMDVKKQMRFERDQAVRGLDEKEAAKVGKEFKKQEDLVDMMYRSLLGQLRKPGKGDRFAEALLNYQFVRLLGGVTISSFPEAVMAPFRLGFTKTLRDGYLPMIRSLKTSKLSKDQLNDLTGALEFEQANVLRSLGGIDDMENLGRTRNSWDITQELLTNSFVKATGIGHWTSAHRRIAAQVSSADIVRTLKRGPKGLEIERLAVGGIGKENYERILQQINKHTQEYKGTFVINPHLWDDKKALELFQNAVQTEIESAILKPGVEALPFFVQQSQWAKVLFQFKSFMSAATSKILISGLQRRDSSVLMGLMGLIAMGTLSGVAHDKIAGRESPEDPTELLLDGIGRSGTLGLIGTTILDTSKAFYSERTRRFGGKFLSSSILGPSAGQIEEGTRAIQGLVDGDVTDKEVKAVSRMIPFNNLFYIKLMTERVFDEE